MLAFLSAERGEHFPFFTFFMALALVDRPKRFFAFGSRGNDPGIIIKDGPKTTLFLYPLFFVHLLSFLPVDSLLPQPLKHICTQLFLHEMSFG